jgi:hypothetical protein
MGEEVIQHHEKEATFKGGFPNTMKNFTIMKKANCQPYRCGCNFSWLFPLFIVKTKIVPKVVWKSF